MSNASDFIIENGGLVKCKARGEVIVPEGVKVIGRRAFYQNAYAQTVVLPAGVETIDQEAFALCPKLESVVIPDTVKKIGNRAFVWPLIGKVVATVPLKLFAKSAQMDAVSAFCKAFPEMDKTTESYRANLTFLGANLKLSGKYSSVLSNLVYAEEIFQAVLEAKTIPVKEVEWALEQLDSGKNAALIAQLLDYKNERLQEPAEQKRKAAAKKREEEKALSTEVTAADWRKIFKFTFEGDGVVITGIKVRQEEVEIPAQISGKPVKKLAGGALFFGRRDGLPFMSPVKLVVPEGVTEICPGAFSCVEDAHVYIPGTVTVLPERMFCASENVTLHLPGSVTQLPEELAFDSFETGIAAIHAPSGSYAEQYAKENNIPFVAE